MGSQGGLTLSLLFTFGLIGTIISVKNGVEQHKILQDYKRGEVARVLEIEESFSSREFSPEDIQEYYTLVNDDSVKNNLINYNHHNKIYGNYFGLGFFSIPSLLLGSVFGLGKIIFRD